MDELLQESQYLPQVSFEAIRIKDLVTDQAYQRNLSEKHVKRASEHFDPYQVNPVKVSRRDGINYVFNGQHTIEIIARVSGSRETPVWCMVYDDLVYKREADIFANQQKYVKTLRPYEIFMANIEAGNSKQLLIKELVESYGMRVTPMGYQNGICAVAALENVYDRYGYEVLSRTLRLLIGTWEGNSQSVGATMIKGLAKLLDTFDTDIKDEIYISKLGNVSVKELIRCAKERRGGAMGYAEAMLVYYNKKMQRQLPFEKLYMKQNRQAKIAQDNNIPEAETRTEGLSTTDSTDEEAPVNIEAAPT